MAEDTKPVAEATVTSVAPKRGDTKEPVEALAERLGTPAWALAGTRVRERWPVGFALTQSEYERAVERFLSGPTALEDNNG